MEDNTESIEQREQEIQSIVQSISQINDMYKDLAMLVVEQVSIVHHHNIITCVHIVVYAYLGLGDSCNY